MGISKPTTRRASPMPRCRRTASNVATHRIFTADEAIAFVRNGGRLTLAPLCGGVPPDIAWKYLRFVDDAVMPTLRRDLG
jgi:hypothetical protein